MFPEPSYVCCSFRSPLQSSEDGDSSGWRGFLSSMGLSIPATLCRLSPAGLHLNQRRMIQGKAPDIPEHVLRLAGVGPDKLRAEWSFPAFITMFLPEFPHKSVPGHEHFQVKLTSTQNWQTSKLYLAYFHTHVSVQKLSRCWVTSPKVHSGPYWKLKTRPDRKHMLSKSVFHLVLYYKTQSSLSLQQLSNLCHSTGCT